MFFPKKLKPCWDSNPGLLFLRRRRCPWWARSKPNLSPQIKITRTANGGVEFTTIPADDSAGSRPAAKTAVLPPAQPPLPSYMPNMMFGQSMQPYFPPPPSQQPTQQQQPAPAANPVRPSVPSQSTPSQPMVTIRRIEGPGSYLVGFQKLSLKVSGLLLVNAGAGLTITEVTTTTLAL
jgi:hypothetical protein